MSGILRKNSTATSSALVCSPDNRILRRIVVTSYSSYQSIAYSWNIAHILSRRCSEIATVVSPNTMNYQHHLSPCLLRCPLCAPAVQTVSGRFYCSTFYRVCQGAEGCHFPEISAFRKKYFQNAAGASRFLAALGMTSLAVIPSAARNLFRYYLFREALTAFFKRDPLDNKCFYQVH